MNKVTSAIQKAIDAIDGEIGRLRTEISQLEAAKKALAKTSPVISKRVIDHYTVASRSGGSPHHVGRYEDNSWDCNCEAIQYDRECWAIKGLRINNFRGGIGAGWFYDEKMKRHDYTWSKYEWPAQYRRLSF